MMKKRIKFSILLPILAIAIAGCNQSNNRNDSVDKDVENSAGAFTVAEMAAVKIKMADGTIMYYTHDTKNQRLRVDVSDAIMLMDYKNKNMSVYAGMWMNIPWNTNTASEDYFDRTSEEGIAEQGYKKTGTMTILGKLCDVYSVNNPDTHGETKCAIWNGVTMWIEQDGEVIYEVLAVTLDIPDNFFEHSTIEHSWIE